MGDAEGGADAVGDGDGGAEGEGEGEGDGVGVAQPIATRSAATISAATEVGRILPRERRADMGRIVAWARRRARRRRQ